MSDFSCRLIRWQHQHGRHDLPWQGADAYRVWLSEIMLQQTQVATVIPYYQRFVTAFPDIPALAAASEEQVLTHWSGLGYYARGRNLRRAAQLIVEQYGSEFPRQYEQILELPGIGRSTAAAICALAYHERRAILDGNVRRVLARYCGIEGWAGNRPKRCCRNAMSPDTFKRRWTWAQRYVRAANPSVASVRCTVIVLLFKADK